MKDRPVAELYFELIELDRWVHLPANQYGLAWREVP
jgi:hypothetical protein